MPRLTRPRPIATVALISALGLCAALFPMPAAADLNIVDPGRGFPDVSRTYASLDAEFARDDRFRSVERVRQVAIGSTRDEVQRAIGQPVSGFSDGSWNYNIALDYPQSHTLVCQYRVFFDADGRVEETVWRRPQCADVIINGAR